MVEERTGPAPGERGRYAHRMPESGLAERFLDWRLGVAILVAFAVVRLTNTYQDGILVGGLVAGVLSRRDYREDFLRGALAATVPFVVILGLLLFPETEWIVEESARELYYFFFQLSRFQVVDVTFNLFQLLLAGAAGVLGGAVGRQVSAATGWGVDRRSAAARGSTTGGSAPVDVNMSSAVRSGALVGVPATTVVLMGGVWIGIEFGLSLSVLLGALAVAVTASSAVSAHRRNGGVLDRGIAGGLVGGLLGAWVPVAVVGSYVVHAGTLPDNPVMDVEILLGGMLLVAPVGTVIGFLTGVAGAVVAAARGSVPADGDDGPVRPGSER